RTRWLLEQQATVESGPREYDYTPGYYAVFFYDPDGMKLELLHRPTYWAQDEPASIRAGSAIARRYASRVVDYAKARWGEQTGVHRLGPRRRSTARSLSMRWNGCAPMPIRPRP